MSTVFEKAHAALKDVVAFYRAHGCPCAYPRFAQLACFSFHDHGVGPVGSHLQQILIALTCSVDDAVYRAEKSGQSQQLPHTCTVCKTRVAIIDEEYSINMRFNRLEFLDPVLALQRGLAAEKIPVPEGGGFFGFSAAEVDTCRQAVTVGGTFEEMAIYLKALDLRWPPRPTSKKR